MLTYPASSPQSGLPRPIGRLVRHALAFLGACPPEVGCYKVWKPGGVFECIRCGE
jgi:hypothetical protein